MTALDNHTDTCHRCNRQPVSFNGMLCTRCRWAVTPTLGAVPVLVVAFMGLLYALLADIAGHPVPGVIVAMVSLPLLVLGTYLVDRK